MARGEGGTNGAVGLQSASHLLAASDRPPPATAAQAIMEAAISSSMNHPQIVQVRMRGVGLGALHGGRRGWGR